MKFFTPLIILLLFISLNNTQAQTTPEFKFHLAFEDGIGAKDTVWVVLDSNATWGVDSLFGEIPQDLSSPNFHVYFKYDNQSDSGKVYAAHKNIATGILAQNYVYPITLKWDTSLLFNHNLSYIVNMAILTNDWFFFQSNDPNIGGAYCLMHDDSVEMPAYTWGSANQFPLGINIGEDLFQTGHVGINTEKLFLNEIIVYPNPSNSIFVVSFENQRIIKKS